MSESGNAPPSEPSDQLDGSEELQLCPPDGAFVTLSEALSWIAFRVSVGCDALSVRLGEDTHAATDGHRLLRTALDDLLNDGRSGRIRLVGKYIASSNVHIATVLPDTIEPIRLLAFARFNIFRDGLEFGTGLTWHHYDGQMMLARPQNERRDYYHSVQVARAELMSHFPPEAMSAPTSRSAAVSKGGAEAECRKWLIQQFDADPDKRHPKKYFLDAAMAEYPGRLSARGFNLRVWPNLAQQHGRDQVGAKKKS